MKPVDAVPYKFTPYAEAEMQTRAQTFYDMLKTRHSIREFSNRPVPLDILETCVKTAVSAPSGANQQSWHFVIVTDPSVKHQIRLAAEEEERAFYAERASQDWLDALAPLGTDADKSFIDRAPCLIVIFAQSYGMTENGEKIKHYYAQESVGIATGFLIAALHHAGLACLTHTPSPMGFLSEILHRPPNERAFINLIVGYPAEDATVPTHALYEKPLHEVMSHR